MVSRKLTKYTTTDTSMTIISMRPAWLAAVVVAPAPTAAAEDLRVEHHPGQEPRDHAQPAGDGHDGHVAVGHVRDLVGQHGLDLGLRRAAAAAPTWRTPRPPWGCARWRRRWARRSGRWPPAAWACRPARRGGRSRRAAQVPARGDLLGVHGEHGDLVAEEVLAEESPKAMTRIRTRLLRKMKSTPMRTA
jgi:hypothetical protein